MTMQQNDIRSQMANKDNGSGLGSILGNLIATKEENQNELSHSHNSRYGTKLKFPKFGGHEVEDWIFRVEQFFTLDKIPKGSQIHVISLHGTRILSRIRKGFWSGESIKKLSK